MSQMMEGFAHGLKAALTGYWPVVGTGTIQSVQKHQDINGRGSGYALQMSAGQGEHRTYVFPVGERRLCIAWRKDSAILVEEPVVVFNRGGAANFTVTVTTAGAITLRRGAVGGTLLATSTPGAVTFDTWHWFWIDLIADTGVAGSASVRLDGNTTPAVSIAGANTANTGTAGWDQLTWTPQGGGGTMWITDIVSYTEAEYTALFAGTYPELFIPGVPPTSDDTNTFVSGGFAQVDEIPWTTADTANANANGQELIMANLGLAWTPPAVYGAANTWYMERDGVVIAMQSRLKSGAADVTGTAVTSLGAGLYAERQDFYARNPDGTIPWTWAAILAAKFGVKTSP
jgi:hypothetical protein